MNKELALDFTGRTRLLGLFLSEAARLGITVEEELEETILEDHDGDYVVAPGHGEVWTYPSAALIGFFIRLDPADPDAFERFFAQFPGASSYSEQAPSAQELVYISGPMSGLPDFNFPAFFHAQRALASVGIESINPAQLDLDEDQLSGMEWAEFLRRDLAAMMADGVNSVVLLPGWRNSRGATLEAYVGRMLGMRVVEFVESDEIREGIDVYDYSYADDRDGIVSSGCFAFKEVGVVSVALEAQDIVLGARRFAYGHPLDNFQLIANLFNATLGPKLAEPLNVSDVAMLMIQVKVARQQNAPKEDNLTDICGYALAGSAAAYEAEARNS
jgi:hypothetical protein